MNFSKMEGYADKGSGAIAAIEAAGIHFRFHKGAAEASDVAAAQAILDAFEPLGYEKAQALARLAAKRWERQNGGCTVAGFAVKTDAAALATLTGAYNLAASGAKSSFRFKAGAGQFVEISAEQMIALFGGVAAFVQACFDREEELAGEIAATTEWRSARIIDLSQGWPA